MGSPDVLPCNLESIVTSLMNETVEMHRQKPHKIEVRHDQFLGLETDLMILHEMVSDQDISLRMGGFTTWVVQMYCLAILNLKHKLDNPNCGDF